MHKLMKRLSLAQRTINIGRSDVMQMLARAQAGLGKNAMVQQLALAPRSIGRRVVAALVIALASAAAALVMSNVAPFNASVERINFALSDAFYKSRSTQSVVDGPVVIVGVDNSSVERMKEVKDNPFPWPRVEWGRFIK